MIFHPYCRRLIRRLFFVCALMQARAFCWSVIMGGAGFRCGLMGLAWASATLHAILRLIWVRVI